MIFITRCTNCRTVFRLTVAQLQIQDGQVRCGQCGCVFNAFPVLSMVADARITSITPITVAGQGEQSIGTTTEITDPAEDGFDFLDPPATRQQPPRSLRISSYFLLVLLLWQVMHGCRNELAIALPAWRSFLENYCAVAQCDIALPQQLALISLESSELRFIPADDVSDEVSLIVTIRNRAAFAQQLPILLLSLTDVGDDRVLASRVLHPQDYLVPAMPDAVRTGFPARSEILIRRHFRLEGIKATGYRLELRYP
ncbi:MAG: zinc-ribbon and DUF3426 domain-containing protein [Nitrosomonas sp.]|nr:zinc-ribbon and DUF3426 domain-containing protein [Nitrosomonas sp.]